MSRHEPAQLTQRCDSCLGRKTTSKIKDGKVICSICGQPRRESQPIQEKPSKSTAEKVLGTIPTGDITLADGRVLRAWSKNPYPNGLHGWDGPHGLSVTARIAVSPTAVEHVRLNVAGDQYMPSSVDVQLVKQAFFGEMTVEEEIPTVRHMIVLRPQGWNVSN